MPADPVTSVLKRFSHLHVVRHHFVLVCINLYVVHYVIILPPKHAHVHTYIPLKQPYKAHGEQSQTQRFSVVRPLTYTEKYFLLI